jgi:hypothetical protein
MSDDQKAGGDQFQGLLDTVERLRRERFPHLDADLVREILRAHADGAGVESDPSRRVEQAVEKYLFPGK